MKGALLSEFYSWRHKRIWLLLVTVAGAVACSASEILFVFLFGIMPVTNFVSGMLAFKGEHSAAVEGFNMSVPITKAQRIAAKYIVLLCENVVMWLCYAFTCITVDTVLLGEYYSEYDSRTAMKQRAIFMVCVFAVAFVLWFLLNCKLKKHRVLVNVLLFLPFAFVTWFIHMEFESLSISSIFRDELWILPSSLVSAVLLLAAGVPLAVWGANRKECSKKMKTAAAVCVALVIVFTALFALMDEYGYFGLNELLSYIFNSVDEDITMPISAEKPNGEQLAVREEMLDFLEKEGSRSMVGNTMSASERVLKSYGFSGERYDGYAEYELGGMFCILENNLYGEEIMAGSNMLSSLSEKVQSFEVYAEVGNMYFETLTDSDMEKMVADLNACADTQQLVEAFRSLGLVPDHMNELLMESSSVTSEIESSVCRGYTINGAAEEYEDLGIMEFSISVVTNDGKIVSVDYSLG